jgi:ubiquinone/menaquinone biosynthesis C-methylase UbiE
MTGPVEDFQRPHQWDAVADKYEHAFVKVSRKFASHALRLAGVRAGMHVLDVCAGTGALTLPAAELGARVDAIDFSPTMVRKLHANVTAAGLQGVTVQEMDGQALAFADDTFDAAFSIFGLMFFPDRGRGFAEQHRVLKLGGRVGAVLWNRPERVGSLRVLGEAIRDAAPDFPLPTGPSKWQELEAPERFRRELELAGFKSAVIHTIDETWDAASPAHLWDDMVGMTPALEIIYRKLGPERMKRVEAAFIGKARALNGGDGPVALACEAHVGIAEK